MVTTSSPPHVAVVGGGITGACVASTLCSSSSSIHVHLFDQGRSGVGGRSSTRREVEHQDGSELQWDHGCQFFRADTERLRDVVEEWMVLDIVSEWKGNFASDDPEADPANEFFGLPSQPPFFVGNDGMASIPKGVLSRLSSDQLTVSTGTRVSRMERDDTTQTWKLFGTHGNPAYHDTAEKEVKQRTQDGLLGEGFDAVVLTDVSSSFGSWHRASAGVPEAFANRVRQRVGARVPLFSAMVAFETGLPVDFDAMSFHTSDTLWFAAKTQSKPGAARCEKECWTLVSTPEYAMNQITETPMQDPKTGEFVPQSSDYLTTIPAPDLLKAFQKVLESKVPQFPEVAYLNAQRWGSAMPCHRHLGDTSPTRRVISGVPYDSGRAALAPTSRRDGDAEFNFLADKDLMLFQAGDMVSRFTPGFESAALSGMDAAEHLVALLDEKRA